MNWYVVQTKPKKEEEATSYLALNHLEVFHPLMEVFIQKNGRMTKITQPLFPGYIFVKFDLYQSYPLVKWARGVKKILGFGDSPTPLSEEVIQVIKDRMDKDGVVRQTVQLKPNDLVRIKSGPLKDLIGIFDRWVSEGERVRILINLIGYQPEVELHYSMLEKVA